MARVCVLEVSKVKCKRAYILKLVKAHHDHKNSAQEKQRPENESPKEIIINRGTTNCLRNGRFHRELSQSKVIPEILQSLTH